MTAIRRYASLILSLVSVLLASCSAHGGAGRMYTISGLESGTNYALRLVAPVQFYPGGEVLSGVISSEGIISLKHADTEEALPCTGTAIFRRNGVPVKLFLLREFPLRFSPGSEHRVFFSGETSFSVDGYVTSGTVSRETALIPAGMRRTMIFPKGTEIWFDDTGRVDSFRFRTAVEHSHAEQGFKQLEQDVRYWFENGAVSSKKAGCIPIE